MQYNIPPPPCPPHPNPTRQKHWLSPAVTHVFWYFSLDGGELRACVNAAFIHYGPLSVRMAGTGCRKKQVCLA